MDVSEHSTAWVATGDELRRLQSSLEQRRCLALDSESNSGFVYRERLCLLQINDGECIWLVDLLALPGAPQALDPLRHVLEDPDYEIQLHGGEFDVACLKRDYGLALNGVWDTQQAASFLGWEKTGYGAVVERICGVTLPKAHTRHDWSRRPIEGAELDYAIQDVEYLPEISRRLRQEVRQQDLEEEVLIACRTVEEATWNGGFRPEGFWSIKGSRKLSGESLAILKSLYALRDGIARELDLPPGRTLNNEVLLALARNAPRRAADLKRLGLPRRLLDRWSGELLETISAARREPPVAQPMSKRGAIDRQAQKRGERLKRWRREEAERRGVPLQVVLPLAALRYLQQQGAGDLAAVPQLGDKRIRMYGETLRRLAPSRP